jgi:hypothetical protein
MAPTKNSTDANESAVFAKNLGDADNRMIGLQLQPPDAELRGRRDPRGRAEVRISDVERREHGQHARALMRRRKAARGPAVKGLAATIAQRALTAGATSLRNYCYRASRNLMGRRCDGSPTS